MDGILVPDPDGVKPEEPLMVYAAMNGDLPVLKYLLRRGADVETAGSAGMTALHVLGGIISTPSHPGAARGRAAPSGYYNKFAMTARFLLDTGASPTPTVVGSAAYGTMLQQMPSPLQMAVQGLSTLPLAGQLLRTSTSP